MSEVRAQGERPVPDPAPVPTPQPAPQPPPTTPEPTPPPVETPAPEPAPAAAEPIPSTLQPSLLSEATLPTAPSTPTFEPYTLPEGMNVDEQQVGALNQIIGNRELNPQQQGQALVELYIGEMQRLARGQHEVFEQTRQTWRDEFRGDPDIGGNRQETSLRAAARVLDRFAGTAEQRAELNAVLNHSGSGDHRALIRLLVNIDAALQPRPITGQAPAPPNDGPGRRYPTMVRSS